MISDRLLDGHKEALVDNRGAILSGAVGPVRRPRWGWIVGSVLIQLIITWLMVAVWFAPDEVVGFGSADLGESLKSTGGRVVLLLLGGGLWVTNILQAAYAYSICGELPLLRPYRCGWTLQTLTLGYISLKLLVADERRAKAKAGLSSKGWGLVSSMMVRPNPAHFGVHDHGIEPGTCRYKLEHFVEGVKVQLVILFLILVDIMAVAFEVVVSANIVEFVDHELGHHIEEALHWTSVAILSLFLLELMTLIYVYRRAFFVGPGSFWLKVDLVVVSVSLLLELVLHHAVHEGEDGEAEYTELAGLLILVRMPWRIVRASHGIIATLQKVSKADDHGTAAGKKATEASARTVQALQGECDNLRRQLEAICQKFPEAKLVAHSASTPSPHGGALPRTSSLSELVPAVKQAQAPHVSLADRIKAKTEAVSMSSRSLLPDEPHAVGVSEMLPSRPPSPPDVAQGVAHTVGVERERRGSTQ
jgi:hypothetical protein